MNIANFAKQFIRNTYKQSRHDIDSTNNGKIVSNTLKSPAHHATQNWISIKVWKPTGQMCPTTASKGVRSI